MRAASHRWTWSRPSAWRSGPPASALDAEGANRSRRHGIERARLATVPPDHVRVHREPPGATRGPNVGSGQVDPSPGIETGRPRIGLERTMWPPTDASGQAGATPGAHARSETAATSTCGPAGPDSVGPRLQRVSSEIVGRRTPPCRRSDAQDRWPPARAGSILRRRGRGHPRRHAGGGDGISGEHGGRTCRSRSRHPRSSTSRTSSASS